MNPSNWISQMFEVFGKLMVMLDQEKPPLEKQLYLDYSDLLKERIMLTLSLGARNMPW